MIAERPLRRWRQHVQQQGEGLPVADAAVNVVFPAVKAVEHPLGVQIADAQVAPGLAGVKVQHKAQIQGRLNIGDGHILRQAEALLNAVAGNAHGDDVLIPVFHQGVDGDGVHKAAVGIELAAQLFQPEAGVIGAGQQHIADLILRQIVDLDLQGPPVRQIHGGDEQLHIRVFDGLYIGDLPHPGAQRGHIQPPVFDDVHRLGDQLLQILQLQLPVHQAAQVLLRLLVQGHDLGQTDVLPTGDGPGQIPHGHHGAVQGAHRGAGHGVIADARLLQGLPDPHLIGAFGAAALQGNGINLTVVQFELHTASLL